MSDSNKFNEPKIIENWRMRYKKENGGIEKFQYLSDRAAREHIKRMEKKIEEVPIYESSAEYPYLKQWAEQIESAIPRIINLGDNIHNKNNILKKSPIIITKLDEMGQLDSSSGPVYDDNYYIEVTWFLVTFIRFISTLTNSLLSSMINIIHDSDLRRKKYELQPIYNDINDIKDYFDNIIGKGQIDYYLYFRKYFYLFMFCDNKITDEENILTIPGETSDRSRDEQRALFSLWGDLGIFQFSIPSIHNIEYIFNESLIIDSIGLFIMGHEYSHIIFDYIHNSSDSYTYNIDYYYQKEYRADEYALKLLWDCMQQKMVEVKWCFVGVEIILNCFYINDRITAFLQGNNGPIIDEKHPPMKRRIEHIRQIMEKLSNLDKKDIMFLDAVDYIFKILGARFIDELTKDKNVLAYRQSKKDEIERLLNEANDLYNEIDMDTRIDINIVNTDNGKKIISLYENILSKDKNNVNAFLKLSMIYPDHEELRDSLKILHITGNHILNSRTHDKRFYLAMFFEGFINDRNELDIMRINDEKLNFEQEKEVNKLFDITKTLFIEKCKNNYSKGISFFEIGVDHFLKDEHLEALEYFYIALEYIPNNPVIIEICHDSITKLAGIFGLTPKKTINKENKKAIENILYEPIIIIHKYSKTKLFKIYVETQDFYIENMAKKGDEKNHYMYILYILGYYYEYGLLTPIDLKKAFFWYKKAAKKGFPPAQYKTGFFYENRKNKIMAFFWYKMAAFRGYPSAKLKLKL